MKKRNKTKAFLFLFGVLLTGAGLAGMILYPSPPLHKEKVRFMNTNGRRLAGVLYRIPSSGGNQRMPTVVLCHGISCSKELMDTMGYDLARHGFLIFSFDYGGHGESESHPVSEEECLADVLCALKEMRRHPEADPDKVALIGHSMGAVSASLAAMRDENVRACVCLGQKGAGTKDYPQNMLQAYCLYDQYHTVPSMREAFKEIDGGADVMSFHTVRDISPKRFTEPGNRALLILPDGDHSTEVYSMRLIPEIRNWLRKSMGLDPDYSQCQSGMRVYFEFLWGVGLCLSGILLLLHVIPEKAIRIIGFIPGVLTLLSCVLLRTSNLPEWISLFLTYLYLIVTTSLYCLWRKGKKRQDTFATLLRGVLLLVISFSLGSILGTADHLVKNPSAILWLPVAGINIVVHRLHFVFNILRAKLFQSYTGPLIPSRGFMILLILEPLFPGLVWRPISWIASRISQRIMQFRFSSITIGTRDFKALVLLIILWGASIKILYTRYGEGLLGLDSMLILGTVILRMYVMPFLVLIILIRINVGQGLARLFHKTIAPRKGRVMETRPMNRITIK